MQTKIKIWRSFKSIISLALRSARQLLLFTLIYHFVVMIIFKPLIKLILSLFMTIKGYPVLINADIKSFFWSIGGGIVAIIILFIASISVYFEFSTILHICKLKKQKEKKNLLFSLEKSYLSMVSLKNKDIVLFFIYSLFILPLFNLGNQSTILPSINIPNFILGEVEKYPLGSLLLVALLIVGIFISARLFLVFPIMIFENKSFFPAAIKSFEKTKKNVGKILLLVSLVFLLSFLVIIIPTLVFIQLRGIILLPLKGLFLVIALGASAILPSTMICSTLVCYEELSEDFTVVTDHKVKRLDIKIKRLVKNSFIKIKSFFNSHAPKRLVKRPYILLVLLVIPVLIITDFIIPLQSDPFSPLVIGHRGSLDGVENTMSAITNAYTQGADYAEIDILLSKDSVPMVIHDTSLARLAGRKEYVYDLTAEELGSIPLTDRGYTGTISTLDEICKISKDKIPLLIELKTHGNENQSVVEKTLEVVKQNHMENQVFYMSSDEYLLGELNLKYPDAIAGRVIFGYVGKLSARKIISMNVNFLTVEESFVTPALVNACYKAGVSIYVWTVNDEESAKIFYDYHVSGIITDYPKEIKSAVENAKLENSSYDDEDAVVLKYLTLFSPPIMRMSLQFL